MYLGMRFTSGEHLVALEDGRVVKTRSIRPFPTQLQWNAECFKSVVGIPWDPVGTMKRGAAENQEPQRVEPPVDGEPKDDNETTHRGAVCTTASSQEVWIFS